jgi:hypothetical protein
MMNEPKLPRTPGMRAIAQRAKLYIYAAERPIQRLERDVENIGQFLKPRTLTPQLQLLIASPPLMPASARLLDTVANVCGERLFSYPYVLLLDSMAVIGPIAAARAFVMLTECSRMTKELQGISDGFMAVFAQYPDMFLAEARAVLKKHAYVKRPDRSGG